MSQCSHKHRANEQQQAADDSIHVVAIELPPPGERKEQFSRAEVLRSLVSISFEISSLMTQLSAPENVNTLVTQISRIAIIKEFAKFGLEETEYKKAALDFATNMVDQLEQEAPEQAARIRELVRTILEQ
jgi:hypothetical protein